MERYIGLDAHTQSCTVAVVGPSGKRLCQQVVETSAAALIEAIKAVPGERHLCMEEGTHAAWLYEMLNPHVAELVVVQPRQSEGHKSDAIDSWQLAEDLRMRRIDRPIFKAPDRYTGLREAVRAYGVATIDLVRAKNRLHVLFRARGIAVGDDVYKAEPRKKLVEQLPRAQQRLSEHLATEVDSLLSIQKEAQAWLEEEASALPEVGRLATVPGIGVISAARIVAIVVTPYRFRSKAAFWSYCGLGVVTRSSADWVRNGKSWVRAHTEKTRGLNRNRHPVLKMVFKSAALTVITRYPNDPLHAGYVRMTEAGIKPNLARVTLARQIAATVLAMWKQQEDYNPARRQTHPA